jgi:hypothetical protein
VKPAPKLVPPEPEGCVIEEYAPTSGGAHWTRSDNGWTDLADGTSPLIFHTDAPRAVRFAPDGRSVAIIDFRGELRLFPVGSQAPP